MLTAIDDCASSLHSHVCKVIHATTGDCFFCCQAHQYGVSIIQAASNVSTKRLEKDVGNERGFTPLAVVHIHACTVYTKQSTLCQKGFFHPYVKTEGPLRARTIGTSSADLATCR